MCAFFLLISWMYLLCISVKNHFLRATIRITIHIGIGFLVYINCLCAHGDLKMSSCQPAYRTVPLNFIHINICRTFKKGGYASKCVLYFSYIHKYVHKKGNIVFVFFFCRRLSVWMLIFAFWLLKFYDIFTELKLST